MTKSTNKNLIHLIFCTETEKSANIDTLYIKGLLDIIYSIGNNVKLDFINLNGKTNYNSNSILRKIKSVRNNYQKVNPSTKSYIIYLIDTDEYFTDPNEKRIFENIDQFCKESKYELIWFCRTIEETIWKTKIERNQKLKYAVRFDRNKSTMKININDISSKSINIKKSNFKNVLDKILL